MTSELVAPAATVPSANDPRLGAWRAFLHAHARLLRRLDEELQAEHGLSLAEYDALLQLAHAQDRRLRSEPAEAEEPPRLGRYFFFFFLHFFLAEAARFFGFLHFFLAGGGGGVVPVGGETSSGA